MTKAQKLSQLKLMLGYKDDSEDEVLAVYLSQSEREILSWRYGEAAFEDGDLILELPPQYEIIQLNAVLAGYNIRGAEGQDKHNENGIYRNFKYEDMVHYIHAHISQMARLF